jgi:putative Holliday junction resolvase
MGIDYGTKRTGIAVTDPLQIIASGLATIATKEVFEFLTNYFQEEEVEKVVVGEPMHKDGNPAQIAHMVVGFVRKLKKEFPHIEIVMHDERGTSVQAKEIIMQSGIKQKKRRDKTLVDKIAAALILEDYLKNNGQWDW